jgi:hypothetical protein
MYIGNDLQIAHPSYKIIDDISSGFNGSTTSFALQVSGATPVPFPISTQQVMISVNGVVQEPDPNGGAGFKLLGSNIVFSSAPANGHAFFGVINAGADYVTAGSEFPDGSATAPSFTFQDDQDTGWFRNASGDVGYSSNGSAILNFDGNGLTIAAGKGLTVDTSTLKVDAANNRVGIGTASPGHPLEVVGDIEISGSNGRKLTFAGDGSSQYFKMDTTLNGPIINGYGGLAFEIGSAGSEKARFDSSGRLLLGTTTEGHADADDFTLAGTGNTGITIRSGASNYGQLFFSDGTSGADEYRGYVQYNHTANSLIVGSNGTAALTIDSSQNATFAGHILSPKLDTNGNGVEVDTGLYVIAGSSLYFKNAFNNNTSRITNDTGNAANASGLRFQTGNNTTALTIDSSQNATFAGNIQVQHIRNDGIYLKNAAGTENYIDCSPNAEVSLFYDNTKRAETTNTGFTVTGELHIDSNGSLIKENQLKFSPSGAAYIDHSTVSQNIIFRTSSSSALDTTALTLASNGNGSFAGTVSDSKGNLRSIPQQNEQGSAHTLVAADSGKHILADATVTAPPTSGIFSAGDAITIINTSGSDISIARGSGVTMYNAADGTNADRTLGTKGMATILCAGSNTYYISGAGLS